MIRFLWMTVVCFTAHPAWAFTALPVGLQPESGPGMRVLRLLILGLGVFLLAAGARVPRFTVGAFLTALLTLAVFRPLSSAGYGVAVLVMILLFTALYLLFLVVPRLVVAVGTLWLLPALYLLVLMDSGSFSWSRLLVLSGLLIGGALGAAFPRLGILTLAAGLGISLVRAAWPGPFPVSMVLLVASGSLAIQLADFFLVRKAYQQPTLSWRDVKDCWGPHLGKAVAVHAGVLLGMLWFLGFSAPMIAPTDARHLSRLSRLAGEGGFSAPALVLSTADNFYLAGRPSPVGILSPRRDMVDRLLLPFIGKNPASTIHRLRAIKDETELAAMRKAAAITSEAMRRVGEAVHPGVGEAELAAIVDRTFREYGADGYAFSSIVGAGDHACLPHYSRHSGTLTGGFVVVDIGCMVDGYCADMTRTFPVKRRYTPAMRELMELVLQAKVTALAELKPGAGYRVAGRKAREVFEKAGLVRFYLHSLGHHVGIEVHDPYVDKLAPGMVVTVEPGLYMARGTDADTKYQGLGLRIEDTYLITDTGYEALTDYPQIPYLATQEAPGANETKGGAHD